MIKHRLFFNIFLFKNHFFLFFYINDKLSAQEQQSIIPKTYKDEINIISREEYNGEGVIMRFTVKETKPKSFLTDNVISQLSNETKSQMISTVLYPQSQRVSQTRHMLSCVINKLLDENDIKSLKISDIIKLSVDNLDNLIDDKKYVVCCYVFDLLPIYNISLMTVLRKYNLEGERLPAIASMTDAAIKHDFINGDDREKRLALAFEVARSERTYSAKTCVAGLIADGCESIVYANWISSSFDFSNFTDSEEKGLSAYQDTFRHGFMLEPEDYADSITWRQYYLYLVGYILMETHTSGVYSCIDKYQNYKTLIELETITGKEIIREASEEEISSSITNPNKGYAEPFNRALKYLGIGIKKEAKQDEREEKQDERTVFF